MTANAPFSPALRWKLTAWALAAVGTADVVAVAISGSGGWPGWLLAGCWFGAAAVCAWQASRLARHG